MGLLPGPARGGSASAQLRTEMPALMSHLRILRTALGRHARPACRQLHPPPCALAPRPIDIPITATPEPTLNQRLKSPLPITEKCPPSSCPCVSSPSNLDIDRVTPLAGAIPPYCRHLLISTGKSDWASRIEFDGDGGLAQRVKQVSSTHGLRDPFSPVLITNSSFAPDGLNTPDGSPGVGETGNASAYVFPGSVYIPHIPMTTEGIKKLIQEYLLPPAPIQSGESGDVAFPGIRRVTETVVLICSHISRDKRCGLLAHPLRAQFDKILTQRGLLLEGHDEAKGSSTGRVRVGFTSHLSGHKFAGNVIVYLPPKQVEGRVEGGVGEVFGGSGLALGVWYGRVEPKHVEGIVDETVVGRRVIGELCRGVVGGEVTLCG